MIEKKKKRLEENYNSHILSQKYCTQQKKLCLHVKALKYSFLISITNVQTNNFLRGMQKFCREHENIQIIPPISFYHHSVPLVTVIHHVEIIYVG